ncbi:MAG: SurA N-terminal domain-containing protein [Armatimonas sp.]
MNRHLSIAAVAALATLSLTGCGDKPALTVNGQAISKDEYLKLLERTTVSVPGGQQAKAERLVLDQIVSNQIILSEAGKAGLLPSDQDVSRTYDVQKKLMEAQQPGKSYEQELAKQGMTPDELKADLKVQMAETNLYARKMNLGENDVKAEYEKNKANIGLPARTQMRLIILQPNSPQVAQATEMLKGGKAFEEVAKTINEPSLLQTGGERVIFDTQLPPSVKAAVDKAKDGDTLGPISWPITPQNVPGQPPTPATTLTAWVKVIKKLNAFALEYADAAPILRRDLVRQKIMDPANAAKRDEVLKIKMQATLDSDDKGRLVVWEDIKKVAKEMGVGETKPPATAPAPATGSGTTAPKPK